MRNMCNMRDMKKNNRDSLSQIIFFFSKIELTLVDTTPGFILRTGNEVPDCMLLVLNRLIQSWGLIHKQVQ